jgi:hypothetical protein
MKKKLGIKRKPERESERRDRERMSIREKNSHAINIT